MKIKNYSFLIIIATIFLFHCDGDDPKPEPTLTQQQIAAKALKNRSPWQVKEVVSIPDDQIDVIELENLKISFGITGSEAEIAPGSFSATGADTFLSSSSGSSWSWSGSGTSTISLTNASTSQLTGLQFSPDSENANEITFTFTVNATTGRIKNISGQYTVTLD